MSNIPSLELNDGHLIPQLGFGVWQVPDAEATAAVRAAIAAGYRSIDTAAIYENETGTGKAVAEALAGGIAREDLYITTKLWNSGTRDWSGEQGRDAVLREFDAALERLGLEYLDLYLIHWPRPMHGSYANVWKALEQLRADGRVRSVGVSNFGTEQLTRLAEESSLVPALNQVELHPYFPQEELRAFHAEHGIATEAWSPLGQGKDLLGEAGPGPDRREARPHRRPGRAPLAPAERHHRDPEVGHPLADQGEPRRRRLRAGRRGPRRDRRCRHRHPDRPGPAGLRLELTGPAAPPARHRVNGEGRPPASGRAAFAVLTREPSPVRDRRPTVEGGRPTGERRTTAERPDGESFCRTAEAFAYSRAALAISASAASCSCSSSGASSNRWTWATPADERCSRS